MITKKKSKRILILVENLPVPQDQRVWREAIALNKAGYQVSIISRKGVNYDKCSYEKLENISIYRFRVHEAGTNLLSFFIEYTQALIMMLFLSVKVFFKEGFDIIQICNPPDFLFLIALPYKLLGKKIIFDHHDPFPEMFITKKKKKRGHLIYKILIFLEKITFKVSDVVMATNMSHRDLAINRGGILEENVFIVRNGPDYNQIKAIKNKHRRIKKKPITLGYIGVIGETDGVDYFLRTIKILNMDSNRTDIRVIIVGGGTDLKKMKKYAEELGIEKIVLFTDRLPYPEAMGILISTDICICPDPKTPYSDLCTLCKTMDYMALAKPIVTFDLKENQYTAGDAAYYAQNNSESDFAEKMNKLINNKILREQLGKNGKERLENKNFYWDDSINNLLAAYEKCFSK